jgi:ABC-2 type transport system ATP-binding protein
MIECQNVTKRFNGVVAVDNVSLQISSGVCALIGPNGAGKSTLLKLLTGLLHSDSGEIRVAGLDPAEHPMEIKRIMGVVPEDLGLFSALSVREHLGLAGPIYGVSQGEIRERTDSFLRVLGLSSFADTFLDQCSHGTRKKTALALALVHNPKVLFLDEPFEGIDPIVARTVSELLKAIAQRGITVFFTSHMLSIVETLATEVMMIRSGRIVWSSTAQAVPRSLVDVYSELVEPTLPEDLTWLRS